MFSWDALQNPDCPAFDRVEDGPNRQPFLIPCPVEGPGCQVWGAAYKIDGKHPWNDGQPWVFKIGCPACRKRIVTGRAEATKAELLKKAAAAWERFGIPRLYKDFSLNARVIDHRPRDEQRNPIIGERAKPPPVRRPGYTYVTDEQIAGAVGTLRGFNPDVGGVSLLLWGVIGNGKTHLAYAWANDRIAAGRGLMVLDEKALHSGLMAPFDSPQYLEARATLTRAAQAAMLLWDDMAFQPARMKGDKQVESPLPDRLAAELVHLVEERYKHQRPMLATTNATLDGLARRLGEPIAGRILEMCQLRVQFTGYDWRKPAEHQ